jgi:hypothetical protein
MAVSVGGSHFCVILDTGCWMLDAGYWMLDAGYWILDTGCLMLDWILSLVIGHWSA